MSPLLEEIWDGAFWRPGGGEPTPPPDPPGGGLNYAQREALTVGAYLPDSPDVTGLLPGWELTDLTPVTPSGGNYYISLSATLYENRIFWGQVRPPTSPGLVLRNCVFAGIRPDSSGTTSRQAVRAFNTNIAHWTIEDCVIDPFLWADASLSPPGGAMSMADIRFQNRDSVGIQGGNVTAKRVEFRNLQDGIQHNRPKASGGENPYSEYLACWIHKNAFYRGAGHSQVEGTHCDAVQLMLGPNLTVRGCVVGGPADLAGFAADPSFNSGDSYTNAGFMVKQEARGTHGALGDVTNVLVEKNWIYSGYDFTVPVHGGLQAYGINVSSSNSPDWVAGLDVVDNWFVVNTTGATNRNVIRAGTYSSCFSGNVYATVDGQGGWAEGSAIAYSS